MCDILVKFNKLVQTELRNKMPKVIDLMPEGLCQNPACGHFGLLYRDGFCSVGCRAEPKVGKPVEELIAEAKEPIGQPYTLHMTDGSLGLLKVWIVWEATGYREDYRQCIIGVYSSREFADNFLNTKVDEYNNLGLHKNGNNKMPIAGLTYISSILPKKALALIGLVCLFISAGLTK